MFDKYHKFNWFESSKFQSKERFRLELCCFLFSTSFVHEIINAATCLALYIRKEKMYSWKPIRKYTTTSSHTIRLSDTIRFSVPLLNLFSGSVDPRALFESSS